MRIGDMVNALATGTWDATVHDTDALWPAGGLRGQPQQLLELVDDEEDFGFRRRAVEEGIVDFLGALRPDSVIHRAEAGGIDPDRAAGLRLSAALFSRVIGMGSKAVATLSIS